MKVLDLLVGRRFRVIWKPEAKRANMTYLLVTYDSDASGETWLAAHFSETDVPMTTDLTLIRLSQVNVIERIGDDK